MLLYGTLFVAVVCCLSLWAVWLSHDISSLARGPRAETLSSPASRRLLNAAGTRLHICWLNDRMRRDVKTADVIRCAGTSGCTWSQNDCAASGSYYVETGALQELESLLQELTTCNKAGASCGVFTGLTWTTNGSFLPAYYGSVNQTERVTLRVALQQLPHVRRYR
jgi:hypothetical protein